MNSFVRQVRVHRRVNQLAVMSHCPDASFGAAVRTGLDALVAVAGQISIRSQS